VLKPLDIHEEVTDAQEARLLIKSTGKYGQIVPRGEHLAKSPRRVVVTGLGVISPIGIGITNFWEAALRGQVGTAEITSFDTSGLTTHKGGEVKDFAPAPYAKKNWDFELPRSAQFAVAVTRMALEDGLFPLSNLPPEQIGVCFGVVHGDKPVIKTRERTGQFDEVLGGPLQELVPAPLYDVTIMSRAPAAEFGLLGPNLVMATACAAGNSAIGYGMDLVRAGKVEAMVVGGTDQLSPLMLMVFDRLRALAPDVVQPFDRNRKGLICSEGAAALLLESYEHATSRGASIYCEVSGHGDSADAYHIAKPHPEGLGAAQAMREALHMSGLALRRVDYISAHGSGTLLSDAIEAKAIRTVFGDAAESIPVSSIKSMLGHTQGAAAAIEAVGCALAIRDNIIPPNMNYHEPDPQCNLDIVANAARHEQVNVALSNAFGFGGSISCVVFSRLQAS